MLVCETQNGSGAVEAGQGRGIGGMRLSSCRELDPSDVEAFSKHVGSVTTIVRVDWKTGRCAKSWAGVWTEEGVRRECTGKHECMKSEQKQISLGRNHKLQAHKGGVHVGDASKQP